MLSVAFFLLCSPFLECTITGEDEQDKGMEMENDFEGEMFDVPKGEDKDQDDKVRYCCAYHITLYIPYQYIASLSVTCVLLYLPLCVLVCFVCP